MVPVVAIKEASSRNIDGMKASISNSDLREMKAKSAFLDTKTARFHNKEDLVLMGTFQFKETLTDITKTSIAVFKTFTTREMITCFRTQGL